MKRLGGLAVMLGLAAASAANAQSSDAAPPATTASPPVIQVLRPPPTLLPAPSLKPTSSTLTTIRCTVTTEGALRNCKLLSEDPPSKGEFGAASLKAAQKFHLKPFTRYGRPVEGTVTIPIRWNVTDGGPVIRVGSDAPPPAAAPPTCGQAAC